MSIKSPPCVVLVEPQHSGNIGMVARAMANFGHRELRLVNPAPHLNLEARKFALHAAPILEGAACFPSLEAALADLHLSVATTRRHGEHRQIPLPLHQLPERLLTLPPGGRSAVVFGREDTGLTSAEVALCTLSATIPTDPGFASLNLAQAVGITLYELSRATAPSGSAPPATEPPTQGELEELFAQMHQTLGRIGFLNADRPELRLNRLRRIYRRAGLDRQELNLLRGMWDQLDWSVRGWSGRKKDRRPVGGGEG